MISGFNHNIQHKGHLYHIQTEDSGYENPHIITLLYLNGTIIAKKKTSYQELLSVGNRETVVRELMEEQHKAMLRELVRGGFDHLASARPAAGPMPAPVPEAVKPFKSVPASPRPAMPPPAPAPKVLPAEQIHADDISALFGNPSKEEKTLDEIILSYLSDEPT